MGENYSISDIAAATRGNNDGLFGGSGIWIFALLILLGMFNGNGFGFGGGAAERAATVGDVQRATDFAALERQNNETVAAVRQAAYDTTSAIKDGQYNILGELRDLQAATASGFAEQQKCCCETLRAIDGVNYNAAINTANINANINEKFAALEKSQLEQRIAQLEQANNQLYMREQFTGVVRYPMSYAYTAGQSPFCGGCNNGCSCA